MHTQSKKYYSKSIIHLFIHLIKETNETGAKSCSVTCCHLRIKLSNTAYKFSSQGGKFRSVIFMFTPLGTKKNRQITITDDLLMSESCIQEDE